MIMMTAMIMMTMMIMTMMIMMTAMTMTAMIMTLLTYMLQHNEHHAQELDQMADNLAKMGMDAAAKTIKESVSDFQKGNMRLSLALTLVKEHLKEVK